MACYCWGPGACRGLADHERPVGGSRDDKVLPSGRSQTVLPSNERATPWDHPRPSRSKTTAWPTSTQGTIIPGIDSAPQTRSAAVRRFTVVGAICMARARSEMYWVAWVLSPIRKPGDYPVTAMVGATPFARESSLRAFYAMESAICSARRVISDMMRV